MQTDPTPTETTGTQTVDAFNFKPTELNRIIKLFGSPLTFNYADREVKAAVLAISRLNDSELDILCDDGNMHYEIGFIIKTRSVRVKRVTPIKPAIQV